MSPTLPLAMLSTSLLMAACGRDQGRLHPSDDPGAARDTEAQPNRDEDVGPAGGSRSDGDEGSEGSGGSGDNSEDPMTELPQPIVFEDVLLPQGETVSLVIENGTVTQLTDESPSPATTVEASGLHLVPGFVDSHVHLTYLPRATDMARGGVLAAVDLAAPLDSLESLPEELHLLPAGPMITSVGGYPTQSWGRNGYGLEVASPEAARAAVAQLVEAGARVIKVPLDGDSSLTDEQTAAVVTAAHDAGLKVAAHALSSNAVERAFALGVDVLAHTPTEELTESAVENWKERAVISTLRAFGAGDTAKANLARLFEAGATVLYGTDFGNTSRAGIDTAELSLLREIGMSAQETISAATAVPAAYWTISEGSFELGGEASFLLLGGDPEVDFAVLADPEYVFFLGKQLTGPDD